MATIPEQMLALVLTAPKEFEIRHIPTPKMGPMEVICRVDAIAICGTDTEIIEGTYKDMWPKSYPFTPGHEWAGTIVEASEGALEFGFKVGDRVAGTSHSGCGYCQMCVTGRYNLCENYGNEKLGHRQYGHYTQGAYAQYMLTTIRSIFKIPDSMTSEEGALVDTASIALHSVKRPGVEPGDTVCIVGAGPMGILCAECASAIGASRVILVGGGERLAKTRDIFGYEIVDREKGSTVEQVLALTGGKGPDVVVDCAGNEDSVRSSVEMVRKGGRVSFTGIPKDPTAIPFRKIVLQEIDLYGVRANRNTCQEVIPLIAAGKVRLKPLITHSFPLTEFATAFNIFRQRIDGALKVIVKPN
jgi:L-iditol 2-dehydrogenase